MAIDLLGENRPPPPQFGLIANRLIFLYPFLFLISFVILNRFINWSVQEHNVLIFNGILCETSWSGVHSKTNRSLMIITTSSLLTRVVFLRRHGSLGYFVKTVFNVESYFLRGCNVKAHCIFLYFSFKFFWIEKGIDCFVSETLHSLCTASSLPNTGNRVIFPTLCRWVFTSTLFCS